MRQLAAWIMLAGMGLASGCATDTGSQPNEARNAPAYRTGSIIPRNRDSSDVQVVDPQAIRDSMGGKPAARGPGT